MYLGLEGVCVPPNKWRHQRQWRTPRSVEARTTWALIISHQTSKLVRAIFLLTLGIEDAVELYTRTALGIQVIKTIREKGLRHKEAGKLLGLKQLEVSAMMRAKFSRFSQERLIGFLNKLEQKVTIQVSRHHRGETYNK